MTSIAETLGMIEPIYSSHLSSLNNKNFYCCETMSPIDQKSSYD